MKLLLRLIRTFLSKHVKGMAILFLLTAVAAATPYAFSMLGRWLVDEALQVTRAKEAVQASKEGAPDGAGQPGFSVAWKAKTAEEKLRLLGIFLAASLGMHLLATALGACGELASSRMAQRMIYGLRSRIHDRIAAMDLAAFSREQVGQLMTRVLDDAGGVPANLIHLVVNFFTQIAMLGLGLFLLLRLNPKMTLFAVAALPFYAVTCAFFLPRIKRNTEQVRWNVADMNGFIVERLSNIATVKNYSQEDREVERFGEKVDRNLRGGRRQQRLNLGFNTLTTLITGFSTLAVLAFGFLNIKSGKMQLGEAMAFYQVTAQLFVPISALVAMTSVAQTLQILGVRIFTVLDTPETIRDASETVAPTKIKGDVTFERVSLRYEEGGPFAVSDVTLQVPAGVTVALVGPMGCGKSSLITLLTRLWDPSEGTIRLDGIDIRRLPVRVLRLAIGNVLHDCQLFTGTFAENIAFGRPDARREDIERVAKTVDLHEFVVGQKGGYDARLGKGGLALDTEQLARLGLARALITNPAVLTIDDTYAVIEEEAERPLRAAVREALADHTVIIATSRLSICTEADMIVVMQRGKIVQTGKHEELLAAAGLYRRMYFRQMGLEETIEAVKEARKNE